MKKLNHLLLIKIKFLNQKQSILIALLGILSIGGSEEFQQKQLQGHCVLFLFREKKLMLRKFFEHFIKYFINILSKKKLYLKIIVFCFRKIGTLDTRVGKFIQKNGCRGIRTHYMRPANHGENSHTNISKQLRILQHKVECKCAWHRQFLENKKTPTTEMNIIFFAELCDGR